MGLETRPGQDSEEPDRERSSQLVIAQATAPTWAEAAKMGV